MSGLTGTSLRKRLKASIPLPVSVKEIRAKTIRCEAVNCTRMFAEKRNARELSTESVFLERDGHVVIEFKQKFRWFEKAAVLVSGVGKRRSNFPGFYQRNLPTLSENYFLFAVVIHSIVCCQIFRLESQKGAVEGKRLLFIKTSDANPTCSWARSVYVDENNSRELFNACKRLLKKLKVPGEEECPWFFSDENNSHQDEKVNGRNDRAVREGHIVTPPFLPQDLRVSADGDVDGDADADADAYVETLQTIVVKPPWKDNLAYAFQQDSVPSHKALKTQDWMDGQEFSSSSCHTKLIPAS
ncbi:hypothetical protein ACTXT7_004448 [Hymenolepis weldensis]